LIHPEDLSWVKKQMPEFIRGSATSTFREYRIIDKNDQIHWVLEHVTRCQFSRFENGVDGTIQDITLQKIDQEQLQLLEKAIDHSSERIEITDVSGTIQYVNNAFEHLTGYSKEKLIGQNPRILKSGEHGKGFYKDLC